MSDVYNGAKAWVERFNDGKPLTKSNLDALRRELLYRKDGVAMFKRLEKEMFVLGEYVRAERMQWQYITDEAFVFELEKKIAELESEA